MKALSIRQPWASLIATGKKTNEFRTWSTRYRGPLVICSGKEVAKFTAHPIDPNAPLGVTICTVDLVECLWIPEGSGSDGTYAFVLKNPRSLPPVPVKGKLGFFLLPEHVALQLAEKTYAKNR